MPETKRPAFPFKKIVKILILGSMVIPLGILVSGCEDEAPSPERVQPTTTVNQPVRNNNTRVNSKAGPGTTASAPIDSGTFTEQTLNEVLKGNYVAVVPRVTRYLQDNQTIPAKTRKRLIYLCAYSAYCLGAYVRAERDLAYLGDFELYPKWQSAPELLEKVRTLKAMIPRSVTSVRDEQGRVIFRVHYSQMDAYTRAILRLLPAAYQANRHMLGVDQYETPVYIFHTYNRFRNFYVAVNGKPIGSWMTAAGGRAGFYLCAENRKGKPTNIESDYFRCTVGHEFNHCMTSRIYGTTLPPEWMREGIAEITGCYLAPRRGTWIESNMGRIVEAGYIVSYSDLTENFTRTVEENVDKVARNIPSYHPYAQGFSMSRYFLKSIPPGSLNKFFIDVRKSRDFPATFRQYTGKSPENFYNSWARMMKERHAG